jgi:5-methylcytosine-specific restriction endonuclease McrA
MTVLYDLSYAERRKKIKDAIHAQRKRWRWMHAEDQFFCCALCHLPLGGDMTLDHIVPLCKGGADSFENTQTTHLKCNEAKGDKHDPVL